MRSVNLTKLCMEEDDHALNEEVCCNHGFVVRLKTSWTPRNPYRRYWLYPYYGGPRSCDFWHWRDKENIDPWSKFVIPKLIEKMSEVESLVEASEYAEKPRASKQDEKLVELESLVEASEEVDKPRASKQDDNCIEMQLEKLEGEIENMKESEKKWRSNMVKRKIRENVLFFVVFYYCVITITISYWFGVIYMKKGSMKLP